MNKLIKICPIFIERNRRPALRSHLQLNNITNSNIMKTRISISAKKYKQFQKYKSCRDDSYGRNINNSKNISPVRTILMVEI
jgi:hypothetical protein